MEWWLKRNPRYRGYKIVIIQTNNVWKYDWELYKDGELEDSGESDFIKLAKIYALYALWRHPKTKFKPDREGTVYEQDF